VGLIKQYGVSLKKEVEEENNRITHRQGVFTKRRRKCIDSATKGSLAFCLSY
jgi:peptidoglycan hydrolase CwlO-like protein